MSTTPSASPPSASTPSVAATNAHRPIGLPEGTWTPLGHSLVDAQGLSELIKGAVVGPTAIILPFAESGTTDLSSKAFYPDKEVVGEMFTVVGTGQETSIVGIVQERIPSLGLTPEHFVSFLFTVDAATGRPGESVKVDDRQDATTLFLAGSTSGYAAYGFKNEEGVASEVTVVDATLKEVRRHAGNFVASLYGAVIDITGTPNRAELYQGQTCETASVYSVDTGEEVFRWDDQDHLGADGKCPNFLIGRDGGNSFSTFTPQMESAIVFAEKPPGDDAALIDFTTGEDLQCPTGSAMRDVTRNWAVDGANDVFLSGEEFPALRVTDCKSGKALYTLPAPKVAKLGAKAKSLVDGVLYVETADGFVGVDVTTGVEDSDVTTYPVVRLGDYLWMSDDTLIWEAGN